VRILIVGASGVLGRVALPWLKEHDVVGVTLSPVGAEAVRRAGAEAAVCDVYDADALFELAEAVRPRVVVNFLTALKDGAAANTRVRREGAPNVQRAAEAAGAGRLVVESVAFALRGDAAAAVAELERATLAFSGEAVVLRFGRFWGPGTFHETAPEPASIHIADAGERAARAIVDAPAGTHVLA